MYKNVAINMCLYGKITLLCLGFKVNRVRIILVVCFYSLFIFISQVGGIYIYLSNSSLLITVQFSTC